ncbi:hypothetical protein LF1_45520 [Rubripirellula obstinata]|uniref:Tellurite resistance protein TerB n=1 Tax=Rubripirellula obstinata TaxID=406547 RepID=A0A5B1CP11_9BACT|nr:hypothetical protein [Rubripirellula obstinata]KAA1261991.1 hypothetical protein LF1_45520 [Rubripirellula obstinata]
MATDALDSRLRALEDEFFYQVDLKLGEQLREKTLREGKRKRLSEIIQVTDEASLDELIDQGIDEETVAVLLLVPLVFVAWADGRVTEAERSAVIECVSQYSQEHTDAFVQIVEPWLQKQPSETLWGAWGAYIQALRDKSSDTVATMLGEKIMEHANRIAKASTSFLSLHRIGPDKQHALNRLRDTLKA